MLIQATTCSCAFPLRMRRNYGKAELYLSTILQPNDMHLYIYLKEPLKSSLRWKYLNNNISPMKARGIDEISPVLYKELSRKGIIKITFLFSVCIWLKYVPNIFKTAQLIILKKPYKPAEQITSAISKLFEKLLLKHLKT